jgi:hypothetical protein
MPMLAVVRPKSKNLQFGMFASELRAGREGSRRAEGVKIIQKLSGEANAEQ